MHLSLKEGITSMNFRQLALAGVTTLCAQGCAGGSSEGPVAQLDNLLNYSNAAQTRYSYTPYATESYNFAWSSGDGTDQIHIGGDMEPKQNLRHIQTNEGLKFYLGESRDGVGVDRLENYRHDLRTRNETDGDVPISV